MGVGRPASGALPPPTPRPLGGLPGATTHWLWVRAGAGVGTRHQPHSARPCELPLRAVGAARGRLGGAPPAWVWGVWGRALSHPRLPALLAGCRGPLPTGCGCGVVRAWGPVTNPTARAVACCGGGMRVPGGGACCLGVGHPGSGALLTPTARPLGRLPGPTTHWLWVRGDVGLGTRHQPHSARSCKQALRAVGAARWRPGGAPSTWVWGVRGRALSHPRPSVLSGMRPGPASHWPWVRCAGVGARLSLAPCAVPRFFVYCARFPGLRQPLAVVAWHLPSCRGCGRRRGSLACLVPRIGAPLLVRSGRSRCSGRLSRRRGAFPHPGGCRPRLYWVAARGRDGVVPGGSLRLRSWAACIAVVWRVWTRSLTRPVSRTVRLATGDSAGAPGLFRVDANTAPFGSEDATPRFCACLRVHAPLGAFWCASPFLWPFSVPSLLVRPP